MKKTMWGGRFKQEQDAAFKAINYSIVDDQFLLPYDIKTSRAHAKCLLQTAIIDQASYDAIDAGLIDIANAFAAGKLTPEPIDEDVHMWIERLLTDQIGDAGKKLHTGRSRNDQVVTTLKLWLKDAYAEQLNALLTLIKTLVELSEQHIDTIMPGYTHLKIAQPISLAFYFMGFAYKLKRDYLKGVDFLEQLNQCPLGSGAIAGSNYPLDRQLARAELGFAAISPHAMDAVSDRDYIADYLYLSALITTHLSQLSEDFIIWQSSNFKFITLSDAFSSGSSLMPQKKNPDALELIRGKAAIANSRLNGILGLLKGLPMSYNKDLQEDKKLVYSAYCDSMQILSVVPAMLKTTHYHSDRMHNALTHSYANATSLADYLVMQGVPFRDAHHVVGQLVAYAIEENKELFELSLVELRAYCNSIPIDHTIYQSIRYQSAMDNKRTIGSTNKSEVDTMINNISQWLVDLK